MKKIILPVSMALLVGLMSFTIHEMEWMTNVDTAKARATKENKLILLSFSGSDWCANCIRLEKTLFESEDFHGFAERNLVLLKADFPMKKKNKLSGEQTTHNEALAAKYNKSGAFPAVLILDANGNVLGTLDNPKEGAAQYLESLTKITKRK